MDNQKSLLKNRLKEAMYLRDKKAADLSKDLDIPKSAMSQYLSGKSQNMDSSRLYAISMYLDVDPVWLMGYDVPMKRVDLQFKADMQITERELRIIQAVRRMSEEEKQAFETLLGTKQR